MALSVDAADRHGSSKEMHHRSATVQPKKSKIRNAVLAIYIAGKVALCY